jgi:hypothetical protein
MSINMHIKQNTRKKIVDELSNKDFWINSALLRQFGNLNTAQLM